MKRSEKKRIQTSPKIDVINNEEEFSVNKVQIMNHRFLLNIVGFAPPKNATPLVRLLYKVFMGGILTTFMFALLGQLMAVYVHWGDIPILTITISHMSGLILALINCAYFIYSKDKFLKLIDLMRMGFLTRVKSKYMEFIHIAERQIRVYLTIAILNFADLAAIWVLKPLIKIRSYENNNATTKGYDFERLIFVIWAPFEIYDSPQFEIIMVLQMFASVFSALTLFPVDVIFLSLMSHAAAQFKVLCAMLNDMHENISESEFSRREDTPPVHVRADDSPMRKILTSANDIVSHESRCGNSGSYKFETARPEDSQKGHDPFRLYLAECIKYHQDIIGFVESLNEIVSIVTFLKVLTFPMLLCMTGFQMLQNYENQNQFIKFASLFAAAIILIVMYCWFGQQLIDESENVQLAFYCTDWYNQTPGFKSLLPLAIMRASRPVTVRAGVFFDMSFLTLSSLVNASYRFMTMLIQLQDS